MYMYIKNKYIYIYNAFKCASIYTHFIIYDISQIQRYYKKYGCKFLTIWQLPLQTTFVKSTKNNPKKIRFWLPLLLVHWVSNLAALRPPKQLTCTHRSGSSSALDVASIKTRIGYPWWWQIFSHFFWFRTVGLQTKQRAKNMEMVKNESLPFFFLRESHVTCNMFRENICQPVITKWESLYVHAMRKNLQFARWCNLNRPSEAFVPKWLEEETPKGCRIRDVHQFKKMHDKKSCNSGAKQHNLYQQPQQQTHPDAIVFFRGRFFTQNPCVFFCFFGSQVSDPPRGENGDIRGVGRLGSTPMVPWDFRSQLPNGTPSSMYVKCVSKLGFQVRRMPSKFNTATFGTCRSQQIGEKPSWI